ncbi:MAG TPA: PilN domain-containing protein [Armatimonadota bacterium]
MIAERRVKKIRETTLLRSALLGLVLLIAVMAVFNVGMLIIYKKTQVLYAANQQRLAKLEEPERQYEQLQADIAGLEPVVTLLGRVRETEGAWMTVIADIGRVIPKKVSIAGINANQDAGKVNLMMTGSAADEKTVGDFMIALREGTQWADNPKLGGVTASGAKDGVRRVQFSLSVPVLGLKGGEF